MHVNQLSRDKDLRRICVTFFPFDPESDIRREAELRLPLFAPTLATAKEIADDLYPLRIDFVTEIWSKMLTNLEKTEDSASYDGLDVTTLLSKMTKAQKIAAHTFSRKVPLAVVTTKLVPNAELVFGRSVPRERIDQEAFKSLYCALDTPQMVRCPFRYSMHIARGWRISESRLRSYDEIMHDEILQRLPVGEWELAADCSVPFPPGDIFKESSPFAALGRFPRIMNDQSVPLEERLLVGSRWLETDEEAARALQAFEGRAFAVECPGTEALGRLREMASSKSGRPA